MKGLVLNPVAALIVLPWQGSHDHITFKPSFLIALINFGKNLETFSWPNLEIRVILPFSLLGLILLQRLIKSSGFNVGFSIPLQNSTCPPSSCLVLSPIQTKWAEVSWYSPVVESTLVIACSKGSNKASCEVQKFTVFNLLLKSELIPQASINAKASAILSSKSLNFFAAGEFLINPKFQVCSFLRSAKPDNMREGSYKVKRWCRLRISFKKSFWIRNSWFFIKFHSINIIT